MSARGYGKCSWRLLSFHGSGSPLRCHNAAVGAGIYILFRERLGLDGVDKRLGECPMKGCLLLSSALAGALHDVGKSSPHYRDLGSFRGHEILSAMIVYEASNILLELERSLKWEALIMRIASWAIARHHAAMEDRHPSSLRPDLHEEAQKAMDRLAREPGCLLESLPRAVRDSSLASVLVRALESLGKEEILNTRRITSVNKDILSPWGLDPKKWASLVAIAAGALIVSDILVAGYEGRNTDEGAGRVYVRWWHRELGDEKVERVKVLARDCDHAEEVLSRTLRPLLSRVQVGLQESKTT